MPRFEISTEIAVPAPRLYDYHAVTGAFARLTPPWETAESIELIPVLENGACAKIRVRTGPVRRIWVAEHRDCEPGKGFTDAQISGPFASWVHRHELSGLGDGCSRLTDRIDYRLPGGPAGQFAAGRFVAEKLQTMFRYRHTVTLQDLERARDLPDEKPMTILVNGATGLVGNALLPYLRMRGHRVRLYQGVTLGAKSFPLDADANPIKGMNRHTIVEDDVVIYSEATILGRVTIGKGSVIGGNVWLTRSVPPKSSIAQARTRHECFEAGGGI